MIRSSVEYEVTNIPGRERSEDGLSRYCHGYHARRLKTTGGSLTVEEPRVRDSDEPFESRLLGCINRIEERLEPMAVEMYMRGLSTHDIEKTLIYEEGHPLPSRSTISRLSEELYAEYEAFAERDLSDYDFLYLFLDRVYEAVRPYTHNQAILYAWAILSDGTKTIINLGAATSGGAEAGECFLEAILGLGMAQSLVVVSDGASALKAAISKHLPQSDRQRCIAQKLRNLTLIMELEAKNKLLVKIKAIFYAPDPETAEILAVRFVATYITSYPALVKCLNDDLDACIVQLLNPRAHRKFLPTTNLLERAFVEEKRRTKTFPKHVNERGALKLVIGSLIRALDNWKRVAMAQLESTQLRTVRSVMCSQAHDNDNDKISFRLAA